MAIYLVLASVMAATVAVLVGSSQAPSIRRFFQRRYPALDFDGQSCLLIGLSLLAAFVLGLFTMYAVLELF